MAVNNSLKFYKGWYGTGLSKVLPDEPKAIIFNEEEGLIYVNNKCYGGATDASMEEGILHITFSDGRDGIDIDFTDTASASEVLGMLERVESAIGGDILTGGSDSDNGLDYGHTNYLGGTETLVEADRNLDTVLFDVDQRVITLESDNATKTWVENNYVGKDDTVQAALITYDDSNTGMGDGTNPVGTAQRAIEVIDSRLDALESLPDFDTVICSTASNTPSGVVWNDGQDDVTGTLTASTGTMHIIYLVPVNTGSSDATDYYDEYISIKNGDSYSWTKIGTTKADLNGYVKTIVINGKSYEVAANGTTVTIDTDVVTSIVGESTTDLNNTDFVNVKAVTVKDTTNGTNTTTILSSVKTVSIEDATDAESDVVDGLATALDVKKTIVDIVDAMDADLSETDSKENVTVSLEQEDGKVKSLGVSVEYATVTKTDGTNGADTTIEVATGDEDKIVLGADVTKLAGFTNARISEEIGKLNSDVTSSGSDDPIEFSVTQQNGLVTGVQVSMLGAEVSFDGTGSDESLEVENENGVVLGSDILKLKDYIDTKFLNDGTTVTNSNGANDALSVVASTDAQGNKNYDINIVWSEFSDQNDNNNGN